MDKEFSFKILRMYLGRFSQNFIPSATPVSRLELQHPTLTIHAAYLYGSQEVYILGQRTVDEKINTLFRASVAEPSGPERLQALLAGILE
jgi:hypothetical protein